MKPRLYLGELRHKRYVPTEHVFSYKVFLPFIDVAQIEEQSRRWWGWSSRRWALARFKREDYLGDPATRLDDAIRQRLRDEGITPPNGPIFLLANWRYFGYVTNPIACYFCYDPEHTLRYVIAEVTNTPWHERVSYVLPVPEEGPLCIDFQKAMHVSPFNPMDMTYRWRSSPPTERFSLLLATLQGNKRVFDAALTLRAKPATPGNMALALLQFPLMTVQVSLGIYWQALRLWMKKVPIYPHPARR